MSKLIAVRGDLEAWTVEPFEPVHGKVELRRGGTILDVVPWQSALKFGYWDER